jgi:hypothetical protein
MATLSTPPQIVFEERVGNQIVAGRTFYVQNIGSRYSLMAADAQDIWRFEARPGDHVLGQTDRVRSELQCSEKEKFNQDIWLSDWIRYETPDGSLPHKIVAGQFHQTEDPGDFSGYPPFEFDITDTGLNVYTASVSEPLQSKSYGHIARLQNYPFPPNVWHSRITRIKFGWQNDAELQIWLDGVEVLDLSGISIGMNDKRGPYYKFGAYGAQKNEQHLVVKYANLEISSSSLRERINQPLPAVDRTQ